MPTHGPTDDFAPLTAALYTIVMGAIGMALAGLVITVLSASRFGPVVLRSPVGALEGGILAGLVVLLALVLAAVAGRSVRAGRDPTRLLRFVQLGVPVLMAVLTLAVVFGVRAVYLSETGPRTEWRATYQPY